MVALVPSHIVNEVIAAVFADAERLNWENLSIPDRSKQYRTWLADPRVGGRLGPFLSSEETRLWLKDGPMKEYSRAMNGIGRHARLIASPHPTAGDIVARALGGQWTVLSDSKRAKPLRVHISNVANSERRVFAWGPERDFKHLIWAALKQLSDNQDDKWVLCVVAPFIDPTPMNLRAQHSRIAARCGVEVVHLTL